MNNARRRMVVQKYHNRPPFDLKKKEAINKHFRKSFQHVEQSFKTIMDHLDAIQSEYDIDIFINPDDTNNKKILPQPKPNNIAPKIIESFKKATPKRFQLYKNSKRLQVHSKKLSPKKDLTKMNSRDDQVPVETLYRNENLNFGKNIPDHKIMKNLLDDLNDSNINIRFDKSTSTTGIIWPIPIKPSPCTKNKVRHNHKVKSNIPMRRKGKARQSTVEPVPDGIKLKCNSKYASFFGSKSSVCQNSEGTFVIENRMTKEKSFVKTQIENFHDFLSKKSTRTPSGMLQTKNNSKNYLGMMNSVKNQFPKIEPQTEVSVPDNSDWSSATEKVQRCSENIKFPRETKDAVKLMIQESRRFLKTPLAKYLKHQDTLYIQPAISMNLVSGFQNRSRYICKKVESNPESTKNHGKESRIQSGKGVSGMNSKRGSAQKPKAAR